MAGEARDAGGETRDAGAARREMLTRRETPAALEVPRLVRQRSELCTRDLRECFRIDHDGEGAFATGDDDLGQIKRRVVNEGGAGAALPEW